MSDTGAVERCFSKGFEGCQPRNKYEVNELIDKTNQAKNSMMRKHGYAPYQHVFGNDLRVPQSLLEEHGNMHYMSGMLHAQARIKGLKK